MKENKKRFLTITGTELMEQEFEPLQFSVEKILPHGLFILAGSGKIGKSWLSLDMGVAVATGGNLWDFPTEQGEVLYLALEDNYSRLQNRLKKIEAENSEIKSLHLCTASLGINSGMLEQTHNFLEEYPNTKLIIVDTLERIRDSNLDKSMYSCDYRDMTALRDITDKHKITLLLIHHTRKMYDPDPLNTLSGSTGLIGSVDGVHVLEKEKRTDNKAKLTIANRDTEGYCFKLSFDADTCKWIFMGYDGDTPEIDETFCSLILKFMKNKDSWEGTATELYNELVIIDGRIKLDPANVKKKLLAATEHFKSEFKIDVKFDRTHGDKLIFLTRIE